jgi:hypothetical protein
VTPLVLCSHLCGMTHVNRLGLVPGEMVAASSRQLRDWSCFMQAGVRSFRRGVASADQTACSTVRSQVRVGARPNDGMVSVTQGYGISVVKAALGPSWDSNPSTIIETVLRPDQPVGYSFEVRSQERVASPKATG